MDNNLFFVLYTLPLFISFMFFTILKIEDKNKTDKTYNEGKLRYYQVVVLSLIPILNWIITVVIIRHQIKS